MIKDYFVRHATIWGAFQDKEISNMRREEELKLLRDEKFEQDHPGHRRVVERHDAGMTREEMDAWAAKAKTVKIKRKLTTAEIFRKLMEGTTP